MASQITSDLLERAIRSAVDAEIKAEVDKAVEEACARVKNRIPDIIASVTLRVHKVFSYQRVGDEMLIHVKLEDGR